MNTDGNNRRVYFFPSQTKWFVTKNWPRECFCVNIKSFQSARHFEIWKKVCLNLNRLYYVRWCYDRKTLTFHIHRKSITVGQWLDTRSQIKEKEKHCWNQLVTEHINLGLTVITSTENHSLFLKYEYRTERNHLHKTVDKF